MVGRSVWRENTVDSAISVSTPCVGLLPVFYVPVIYLTYGGVVGVYMEQFTQLMKVGGAFAPAPIGLAVLYGILVGDRVSATEPQRAALLSSMLLFAIGGGISLMIKDSNTIITAHYHGTGGAVSLAFMGLTLHLFATTWLS